MYLNNCTRDTALPLDLIVIHVYGKRVHVAHCHCNQSMEDKQQTIAADSFTDLVAESLLMQIWYPMMNGCGKEVYDLQ